MGGTQFVLNSSVLLLKKKILSILGTFSTKILGNTDKYDKGTDIPTTQGGDIELFITPVPKVL